MSQNDLVIANQTFPQTRSDLNSALQALGSLESGASAPSTTYPYMWWADTANGVLRQRNAADSGWIIRASLSDDMVLSKSAAYTITIGDYNKTILANAAGGAFTLTLANAASAGEGFPIFIKKTDNTANKVTISGTIDGAASITLDSEDDAVLLIGNATNYNILSITKYGVGLQRVENGLAMDINGLTDIGTGTDTANDFLVLHDASANQIKKVSPDDLGLVSGHVELFTSNDTFVVPDGITLVYAEVQAAGGGGGGRKDGQGGANTGGTGGGGGNYSHGTVAVTPGENITISIGTGGTNGTNGAVPGNGTNGGNSSFGSDIVCGGGIGGLANSNSSSPPILGGLGGQVTTVGNMGAIDGGTGGTSSHVSSAPNKAWGGQAKGGQANAADAVDLGSAPSITAQKGNGGNGGHPGGDGWVKISW